MTRLTKSDLAAMRARAEAADGTWELLDTEIRVGADGAVSYDEDNSPVYRNCYDPECDCMNTFEERRSDVLRFIVNAVVEIPRLLDQVERMNEALKLLLSAAQNANDYDDVLVAANRSGWADAYLNPACVIARAAILEDA